MLRNVLALTSVVLLGACGGSGGASRSTASVTTAPEVSEPSVTAAPDTAVRTTVQVKPPVTPAPTEPPPVEMPDVVGKTEADALAELGSLGVTDVTFTKEPTLAEAGRVVDQVPSAGGQVKGQVTLTLAEPLPPMPDYAGVRVGDARSELEAWGVTVKETQTLTTERPDGEVIASVPASGKPIGSEVRLEVATAPVVGRVGTDAELVERDGNFSGDTGPIEVSGELFEQGIFAYNSFGEASPGDTYYWEFNLSRDWEKFEASFGLSDKSDSEQRGRFRVLLDGNEIWTGEAAFGELKELSLNVSKGLRLRLEAVSLGTGRIGMVWGDPVVLGLPGVVSIDQSPED